MLDLFEWNEPRVFASSLADVQPSICRYAFDQHVGVGKFLGIIRRHSNIEAGLFVTNCPGHNSWRGTIESEPDPVGRVSTVGQRSDSSEWLVDWCLADLLRDTNQLAVRIEVRNSDIRFVAAVVCQEHRVTVVRSGDYRVRAGQQSKSRVCDESIDQIAILVVGLNHRKQLARLFLNTGDNGISIFQILDFQFRIKSVDDPGIQVGELIVDERSGLYIRLRQARIGLYPIQLDSCIVQLADFQLVNVLVDIRLGFAAPVQAGDRGKIGAATDECNTEVLWVQVGKRQLSIVELKCINERMRGLR